MNLLGEVPIVSSCLAAFAFGSTTHQMTAQDSLTSPNRLRNERSSYLKSAAHQPVNWYPWGKEALEAAKKANKPILLDIGAVWCHWCHVMDAESYENESVATIINQGFIAIKVDRDERPDIDSRYQAAVSAISGQGGWPLTAFLTPEGKVFYGGTYFPPEDRYGRAGFPTVLKTIAETYKSHPDKVAQNVGYIDDAVRNYLGRVAEKIELSDALIDSALNAIARSYDQQHGGFGSAPKFPHSGVVELLLSRHEKTGEKWMADAITNTLRRMARGGIHDQIGGGFHRYSTDNNWIVPHFEKMLYDNAPLLSNYVHAYQVTKDEFFKSVALDIIRFTTEVLSDQSKGGFYASQDADVEPGDDGSYFTWTAKDAADVLNEEEFAVVQLHFNIYEYGEMHRDSSQNVLFVDKDLDVIASILKKSEEEVEALATSAKRKMIDARQKRQTPFVDKLIYSSWNGMMISAYLEAYKAFGQEEIKKFALKSLERILQDNSIGKQFVTHGNAASSQEGFLDDQVEIAGALLSAYEVTTDNKYLESARNIVKNTVALFWDDAEGGFTDTPRDHSTLGSLSIVHKPIQDSPTPGSNAVAIQILNRLATVTEDSIYRDYAEKTLRFFSGSVQSYGIFAATYVLALDNYLRPPPHVVVIAEEGEQDGIQMFQTALRTYRAGKIVTRFSPRHSAKLPAPVKAIIRNDRWPVAYVCSGFVCAPPAYDSESVALALRSFAKSDPVLR